MPYRPYNPKTPSQCKNCLGKSIDFLNADGYCSTCNRLLKRDHDPDQCEYCKKGYIECGPFADGGIHKRVIKRGKSERTGPQDGNKVKFQFIARRLDGDIFLTTREKLDGKLIGGTDDPQEGGIFRRQLPCIGLDHALCTMIIGEISEFIFSPKYGYGAIGLEPKVGPNEYVSFEIELIWHDMELLPHFPTPEERDRYDKERKQKEKEEYEKNPPPPLDNKIVESNKEREEGNNLFKEGKYEEAAKKYDMGFTHIFHTDEQIQYLLSDEERKKLNDQKCVLHLNRGQCKLFLERWEDAQWDLDSALKIDPKNQKGLYRRAKLYEHKVNTEFQREGKEYWDLDRTYILWEKGMADVDNALKDNANDKILLSLRNTYLGLKRELDGFKKKYEIQQKQRFGNIITKQIEKEQGGQRTDSEFDDMPGLESVPDEEYWTPDNLNK